MHRPELRCHPIRPGHHNYASAHRALRPNVRFAMQGYVNLKAYKEFDNNARPDGWNAWLTLSISPAPPTAAPSPPLMVTKAPPRY